MTQDIQKLEESQIRIANVYANDLASQEVVDAICYEAKQAQKMEVEAKGVYTEVKDNAKRLFRERFGENHSGALYSPSQGIKITQTVRGGGAAVDQELFLNALYEFYGEEPGNLEGQAWKAFEMVSVPVECPRVIDPEKFDQVFTAEQSIAAGVSKEKSVIPLSVFVESQVEQKSTVAISVKNMTKAEREEYTQYPDDFRAVV